MIIVLLIMWLKLSSMVEMIFESVVGMMILVVVWSLFVLRVNDVFLKVCGMLLMVFFVSVKIVGMEISVSR